MAPHQQKKTAVVALFLAALVVASPATAYRPEAGYAPGAATGTPAEATPTEISTPTPVAGGYTPGAAAGTPAEDTPTAPADSTPTAASTPAEETPTAPADSTPTEASTPAEETSTDTADSTPTEASTPAEETSPDTAEAGTPDAAGYTPSAPSSTTPFVIFNQKFMKMVNATYKKALEAANAAAPDEKYWVFNTAFHKGIKEGVADNTESECGVLTGLVDRAVKDAYFSIAASSTKFDAVPEAMTESIKIMGKAVEAGAAYNPATCKATAYRR